MWDFVMDKSGAGAGFLRELWFPLPIYIPSASPQPSSLSPETGTIGQEWPHKPNKKKNGYCTEKGKFTPLMAETCMKILDTICRPKHNVNNLSRKSRKVVPVFN
jgi:hypothetical protein